MRKLIYIIVGYLLLVHINYAPADVLVLSGATYRAMGCYETIAAPNHRTFNTMSLYRLDYLKINDADSIAYDFPSNIFKIYPSITPYDLLNSHADFKVYKIINDIAVYNEGSFSFNVSSNIEEINKVMSLIYFGPIRYDDFLKMPGTSSDNDGDGIEDSSDNCPNNYNTDQSDVDSDGVGDVCDGCPNDPNKTEPGVCGCGVPDVDTDSDGTLDCNDNCPTDPNKIEPGICGCGIADTDSDGDGTPDCIDNCDSNPNKTEPGICGCGVPDTDTDGDGVPDCNDGCDQDANKTIPGVCGCGIPDTDSDQDGMADCWEEDYGLNISVDDANGDLDGDGFTNIIEYKMNTDPNDPNSYPSMAMPWIPLLLLND